MKNIKGIILTKNKKFLNDDGNVFHGMRKSDNGYTDFNEIYFSFIKKKSYKSLEDT